MEIKIRLDYHLPYGNERNEYLEKAILDLDKKVQNDCLFNYIDTYAELKFKLDLILEKNKGYPLDFGSLSFRVSDILIKNKESYPKDISEETIKSSIIESYCEKFSFEFIYSATLTYPIAFEFFKINIVVDEKVYTQKAISSFNYLLLKDILLLYNFDYTLNINETFVWINNVFNDEQIDKKIKITLSSFSFLWNSSNYEDFLYTIIGIESIYNINKQESIIPQTTKGINNVLNLNLKKEIDEIYNLRSRLLHGDIYFSPKHLVVNYEYKEKSFDENVENVYAIAFYIFVATLQKYIKNNSYKIKIETNHIFE